MNIKKQKEEFSKPKPNRHRNNRGDWTTYIGIKSSTSVDGYWEVFRKINGELLHGGSFPTKKEAALASDKLYLLNIDKVEVNKLNFNRKVRYYTLLLTEYCCFEKLCTNKKQRWCSVWAKNLFYCFFILFLRQQ